MLEPLLADILIKETFEPSYIAGNSAVLLTRAASLPMLWIFNLFSLISCTLLFLVTVYDGCVWKKNVSLGKQLQFVNLKMLVLTLSLIFLFPHPISPTLSGPLNYVVGVGCGNQGAHLEFWYRRWRPHASIKEGREIGSSPQVHPLAMMSPKGF